MTHHLLAFLLVLAALPAAAVDLTVTTAADIVNGDTSGPDRLKLNPGPDGIALREAILAINTAPGPHRITFSPELAGQTFTATAPLPAITRYFVTIAGSVDPDGLPVFTVTARSGITVSGSHFAVTGLRFSGTGVHIHQGEDFRIEANIFIQERPESGFAVGVSTDNGSSSATIRDVTIAGNIFEHYGDVALGCGVNGTSGMIENVVISGNSFEDNFFAMELVLTGINGRMSGVRIEGNRFANNHQGITLNGSQSLPLPFLPAASNVLENVSISGNVMAGDRNPSILMTGGFEGRRGSILNTVIANNLITGKASCAICILGGNLPDGGNRVEAVRIVNNTISVSGTADAVSVYANTAGGTANQVTGLAILNTILQVQGSNFTPEVAPDHVRWSLLHPAKRNGFVGVNGNIEGDPQFANPTQGDFHLQPGSRAIDAGTGEGAPAMDLECRSREGRPDIGAFEAGGRPVAVLRFTMAGSGSGTVSATPSGRDCYGALAYDSGTTVTLTPTPATGSVFDGWRGSAACSTGVVALVESATCVATFKIGGVEPQ